MNKISNHAKLFMKELSIHNDFHINITNRNNDNSRNAVCKQLYEKS